MSIGGDGTQVVDRYELDVVAASFRRRPQYKPSDAAKTVNANANRHSLPSLELL
jgi:hypothetical protein